MRTSRSEDEKTLPKQEAAYSLEKLMDMLKNQLASCWVSKNNHKNCQRVEMF